MINYSITARAVNPNLFEINQAKTRINQAKAEGKQPDPKDEALVGTVVTNYGSPDKPGGLSIQLCKSEKKEFYIRYSS